MEINKDIKSMINDTRLEAPDDFEKVMIALGQRSEMLSDTFSSHMVPISNSIFEISEEIKKENKKLQNLESDLNIVKTEALKVNFRLDSLETEVKRLRKDFNNKTDHVLEKFNIMIELLSKMAHG